MLLFKQSSKKFETGAALVEFAIVVPLLLLLVVGISEFGYAYYHLNILNKSVQDGARYFSNAKIARNNNSDLPIDTNYTNPPVKPSDPPAAGSNENNVSAATNLVIYGKTATGTLATQLLPGTAPAPVVYCAEENTSNALCATTTHHIRVTATYQHNFILGNVLYNFLGITDPFPLTASSVLRVE